MSWYALFVKTGYESNVKKWLDNRFDSSLLYSVIPRRKVPEKKAGTIYDSVKTLFPGYVFVRTRMNFSTYYQFKENPHIFKTLNYLNKKDKSSSPQESTTLNLPLEAPDESSFFKEIPIEEMLVVLKLIDDNEIIEYSQVSCHESKVIVEAGPLKGMESYIKKIDKHKKRAKVRMTIMGAEQLIDFGIEINNPS